MSSKANTRKGARKDVEVVVIWGLVSVVTREGSHTGPTPVQKPYTERGELFETLNQTT